MLLSNILSDNNWSIKKSPADSHCLLHSIISSTKSQLPGHPNISLQHLKDAITTEVSAHKSHYLAFGLSPATLDKQMCACIYYKDYDTDFGDMVPAILARALKFNITVLDTDPRRVATVLDLPH